MIHWSNKVKLTIIHRWHLDRIVTWEKIYCLLKAGAFRRSGKMRESETSRKICHWSCLLHRTQQSGILLHICAFTQHQSTWDNYMMSTPLLQYRKKLSRAHSHCPFVLAFYRLFLHLLSCDRHNYTEWFLKSIHPFNFFHLSGIES